MPCKTAILVRYGELALKSDFVRKKFEKRLAENIKKSLKAGKISATVRRIYGRIFVETSHPEKAEKILRRIFGIVSFSICRTTDSNLGNIIKNALQEFRSFRTKKSTKPRNAYGVCVTKHLTFKVDTNRVGQHPYTSQAVNEKVGAGICKKFGLGVNLSKPDKILHIDIRDKTAYIFTEKIPGPGGFPVGTQGKVLSIVKNENGLLSSWLMMKRGAIVVPVFAGLKESAAKKYARLLEKWNAGHRIKYHAIGKADFKGINKIIESEKALGVVLPEMDIADKRHYKLPVFYPLIGFSDIEIKNKLNIISI